MVARYFTVKSTDFFLQCPAPITIDIPLSKQSQEEKNKGKRQQIVTKLKLINKYKELVFLYHNDSVNAD